jgi:hypothetical protein
MFGPASIKGRFFYNDDLSGFNFQQGTAKLAAAFDYILEYGGHEKPPALAVQSVPTRANLPGFEAENRNPLLGDVEARVWIGTAGIVAAHHDPSENIARAVAGKRRFTPFAPDQVSTLYIGPYELTPAGDHQYGRLRRARYGAFKIQGCAGAAVYADLEPGDAIYIPYLWWHHVRSRAQMNMLVNYWWAPPAIGRGAPRDAFLHAMMEIKDLPPAHRDAWRVMFEHYVFKADGEPGAHLRADRRGIVGQADPDLIRSVRAALARILGRT